MDLPDTRLPDPDTGALDRLRRGADTGPDALALAVEVARALVICARASTPDATHRGYMLGGALAEAAGKADFAAGAGRHMMEAVIGAGGAETVAACRRYMQPEDALVRERLIDGAMARSDPWLLDFVLGTSGFSLFTPRLIQRVLADAGAATAPVVLAHLLGALGLAPDFHPGATRFCPSEPESGARTPSVAPDLIRRRIGNAGFLAARQEHTIKPLAVLLRLGCDLSNHGTETARAGLRGRMREHVVSSGSAHTRLTLRALETSAAGLLARHRDAVFYDISPEEALLPED